VKTIQLIPHRGRLSIPPGTDIKKYFDEIVDGVKTSSCVARKSENVLPGSFYPVPYLHCAWLQHGLMRDPPTQPTRKASAGWLREASAGQAQGNPAGFTLCLAALRIDEGEKTEGT
jgi:hypothetical protein